VFQLGINHLVLVLCRPVWVSEACQLFLIPSQNSYTPIYPSKCCELGSVPRHFPLPLFLTWTHIWVLQGVGSASLHVWQWLNNMTLPTPKSSMKVFLLNIMVRKILKFKQLAIYILFAVFNVNWTLHGPWNA
jgi:hypothetical protein